MAQSNIGQRDLTAVLSLQPSFSSTQQYSESKQNYFRSICYYFHSNCTAKMQLFNLENRGVIRVPLIFPYLYLLLTHTLCEPAPLAVMLDVGLLTSLESSLEASLRLRRLRLAYSWRVMKPCLSIWVRTRCRRSS